MHTTGIILSALKQILQPLGHRESGSDIHICLFVLLLGEGDGKRGVLNNLGFTNTQRKVIFKVMIYHVSLPKDWQQQQKCNIEVILPLLVDHT